LQHGKHLGDDERSSPIPAVDPDSGDRRQKKGGYLAGKAGYAKQGRGTSETIDQPTRGYPGHPRADEGNGLSGEKQPVVSGSERPKRECPFRNAPC